MKLQCGLYHFDHRPVTPDDSARLLDGLLNPPNEIVGRVARDSIVMIYCGDRITKEEDTELQPFRLGPYSLTWDGRLDNREDLASRIGLGNLRDLSDPALVLEAYWKLGDSVLADLVGEFALVLWTDQEKRLRFARSTCGARTLYYVIDKGTFTWSSNFAHLVRVTDVDLAVNDGYAIQYLVSQPPATMSPLRNVGVIPPNQVVEFINGGLNTVRELWNPSRFITVRHRSDEEYEEHFREILKEAVGVRLRSNRPVFAELSGGLDSSTVVLMADHVLRQKNRRPTDLQTTSCVYEKSQSCDERRFIQAVEEKRGISTHLVHEQDQQITLGLKDPEFTGLPNALHCFPGRYKTVAKHMKTYGARVLLTGRGGDHLFWSEADGTPLIADEIRRAQPFKAHDACRTWSRAASAPYFELLVKKAIPLAVGSWFPASYSYKAPVAPVWLHPKFQKEISAITPNFAGHRTWQQNPSKRAQIIFLGHMFRYLGSGFFQEYGDVYVSHPYSHRPLIEFCLGTPVSQFLRNGETRSLMRRALRDLLPPKTAKRVSKGLLDETITRSVQKEWTTASDLSTWQICKREYAIGDRMRETLNCVRLGTFDLTGSLIRIFSLERWLRSLSSARGETVPVLPKIDLLAG